MESVCELICRQILFSPASTLTDAVETVHLPPLILLHHIIVLSPLRLPHEVHRWTEQEYFLWVQKHTEEKEQWDLLEKAVDEQLPSEDKEKINGEPGGQVNGDTKKREGETEEEGEKRRYVGIIKEVLRHARGRDG